MKWFKHYTDASFDSKICELEENFGYTGYGVYFKVLEFCSMQWDGKSEPKFHINRRKVRPLFRINATKAEHIFNLCDTLKLFNVKINEKTFEIEIPNLLKIKDNHTKNLQATSKLLEKNLPLEQIRTEKKRKEKNIYTHVKEILDAWNVELKCDIELTPPLIRDIEMRCNNLLEQNLGTSQIINAIKNYAAVTKLESTWFDHRYTIKTFVSQKPVEMFIENFEIETYMKKNTNEPARSKYD